jgi:hypothetical protein
VESGFAVSRRGAGIGRLRNVSNGAKKTSRRPEPPGSHFLQRQIRKMPNRPAGCRSPWLVVAVAPAPATKEGTRGRGSPLQRRDADSPEGVVAPCLACPFFRLRSSATAGSGAPTVQRHFNLPHEDVASSRGVRNYRGSRIRQDGLTLLPLDRVNVVLNWSIGKGYSGFLT